MPWRPGVLLAATGTILFPVASLAQPTVPDVPKEIAVPPGHKLLFKVEGKGVQIYKAVAGKSGTPEWVLEAPLADLFECEGGKAGCHYDNPPSWEAADGSKVVKSGDAKSGPGTKPQGRHPLAAGQGEGGGGQSRHFQPCGLHPTAPDRGREGSGRASQARRDESRRGVQGRVLFLRQSGVSGAPNQAVHLTAAAGSVFRVQRLTGPRGR